MELRLDGKVAVVTGASRGIGKGIAKAYVDAGASVMLVSRKLDGLEAAAAELGGDVAVFPAHVGRPEDAEACMQETMDRWGSVDVLVNNAATNPYAGPTIDCDLSRWDKTHEVNLRGPFAWTQAAWRASMKERGGSVINIASAGAFLTSSQLGVYGTFKAAMVYLTKQLASEMAPKVRVNCIAPGLIKTDFARILWEGERGAKVAEVYPMKRLGETEDIGEAALFLTAAASWMTGQTLVFDGGELIRQNENDIDG
jgi:NAD(P)-dependent dehydrogenase (short-subunit alcohol dehydrogenase family)